MLATQNVSLPYSFAPDQCWNGNAGSWSTFIIRIGTPSQDFSVLPSTSGHQPWVPVPAGCTSNDPPDCGARRGVLPFQGAPSSGFLSNKSSTWVKNGLFNLDIETHLGLEANGDYGYDTVGLGMQNSGRLTLSHQVVAGIATKDIYLGEFGLGPKPSNFSSFDNSVDGYLKNLVNSNLIPSFAYGYTAGAKYRLNQVLASLTLGGYDASRFVSSNISIPFSSDDSRSLTVGVQSISVTNSLEGSLELLTPGEYFLIDSSVPDLWLPEPACQLFEQAFGLIYGNITDLYLVNDSIHSHLVQLNPSITLKMGMHVFDGPTVSINLPYGAFDLQASSPIYSNPTNYFPIRRGANNTQYTLGRTFLQEAYIVVDYERSVFSVNPAVFRDPNPEDIVAIHSLDKSSPKATSHQHLMNRGAIVGITIGSVTFLLVMIAISIILLRWNNNAKRNNSYLNDSNAPSSLGVSQVNIGRPRESLPVWISELDSKNEIFEAPQELSSRPRYELGGPSGASELPCPVVSGGRC